MVHVGNGESHEGWRNLTGGASTRIDPRTGSLVLMPASARVLLCLPSGRRWQAAQELVARAEAADRYRRRLGRTHPGWGNGTLMAAAMARPMAPGHRPDHPDYADCLMLVLDALRRHRAAAHAGQPLAQRRSWARGTTSRS